MSLLRVTNPLPLQDNDQGSRQGQDRGLAQLVSGGGCNRNGTCWSRLIGLKAKVLRGSNACRGELRRRARAPRSFGGVFARWSSRIECCD